jgi:hypothetical protein
VQEIDGISDGIYRASKSAVCRYRQQEVEVRVGASIYAVLPLKRQRSLSFQK